MNIYRPLGPKPAEKLSPWLLAHRSSTAAETAPYSKKGRRSASPILAAVSSNMKCSLAAAFLALKAPL